MSQDAYYTIATEGTGLYREKMSRFLAFAFHVTTADEARSHVKRLQNEYHDARHVCWAYMLGPEGQEFQLNDNGEPSGTAGKPILGQIRSAGLTDVAVIVVRYFGGIKLGTPGLTAAYRQAAREALDNGGRRECFQTRRIVVTFPYARAEGVMRIAKEDDVTVTDRTFDNQCTVTLEVRLSRADEFLGRLSGLDEVNALFADSE